MPTHSDKVKAIWEALETLRTANPIQVHEIAQHLAESRGGLSWMRIKEARRILALPKAELHNFHTFIVKIESKQLSEWQDSPKGWPDVEEGLEKALEHQTGLSSVSFDEVEIHE